MMYLCFGKNCPRPNKRWPRLDNFKQHLTRMHHDEDEDSLLKQSMERYTSLAGCADDYQHEDIMPVDEGMFEEHSLTPYSSIELDPSTNDSMKNLPVNFYLLSPQAATPKPFPIDPFEATGADFQPTISSASKSANPSPSLTLATHDSSKESVSGIIEPSVADSAHRVINFITHMIREDRRIVTHHSDKGIDFYSETSQLSQPQRTLLQKVLSVALGQISDDTFPTPNPPEPTEEKQGGFQCNVCSKRTRLRCEMKKHQKRHERPYGCTFPHCAKSFGSKADWKRHESSQHLNVASWLCAFHDDQKNASCGRIFYREETYSQHLTQQHHVPRCRLVASLQATRLDQVDRSQFWCGFCEGMIALQGRGAAALDERFNHIDTEHFKKGDRQSDWCFPQTKDLGGLSGTGQNLMDQSEHVSMGSKGNGRKRKLAA